MLESHQVEELLTKAAAQGKLRHVVYVSSVGAEKAGFQFTLDSLGGALERKKGVEQAVRRLAKALGFSYSIVRVGALGAAKAGEEAVLLEPADSLAGATALPTAAQAVLQSLALPSALNATFSVVNTKGELLLCFFLGGGGECMDASHGSINQPSNLSISSTPPHAQAPPRRTRSGATAW